MCKQALSVLSKRIIAKCLLLSFIALLVSGCSQAAAPNVVQTSPGVTNEGYPAAQASSYPGPGASQAAHTAAQGADGYPAPDASVRQGPQFTLNEPIKATDTQISGTGPANVPIKLLNMTQAGSLITETTIGTDGTFNVNVNGGFGAGDRIAITLGDTQGTVINPSDFVSGPGYQDFPLIGIVFDSVLVE